MNITPLFSVDINELFRIGLLIRVPKKEVMKKTKLYNRVNKPSSEEREQIINFLFKELEEYGDEREEISKAIDYSLEESPSFGGFILTLYYNQKLVGVVVVNRSGMEGYIPENILVYIATKSTMRGKGLGSYLMKEAISYCEGDIALHVEPENPAAKLYQKLGFTNKYLEMRLTNNR